MNKAVCILIFVLLLGGCKEIFDEAERERAVKYRKQAQEQAKEIFSVGKHTGGSSGLYYIQDSRTGICFAYAWVGSGRGGPSLATVPCEKVPADLMAGKVK